MKPELLIQLNEEKNALSVSGKYGQTVGHKRPPVKAEVFTENDVIKRMGLTAIKDDAELIRTLKPEHRRFLEKNLLNEPENGGSMHVH